jgi:hypothetical protein
MSQSSQNDLIEFSQLALKQSLSVSQLEAKRKTYMKFPDTTKVSIIYFTLGPQIL